jgi:hypothetical protein
LVPAFITKFIARRVLGIATWANPGEFGTAFAAELGTFSVFKLAFRAFHFWASFERDPLLQF